MTCSINKWILIAAASASLAFAACAQEVSHSESDQPGWFGGTTHKESTTYQNPDGTISTDKTVQTVK